MIVNLQQSKCKKIKLKKKINKKGKTLANLGKTNKTRKPNHVNMIT